jgi:hypothetical protein
MPPRSAELRSTNMLAYIHSGCSGADATACGAATQVLDASRAEFA